MARNRKGKSENNVRSKSMNSILGTGNINNPLLDSTCTIPFSCRIGDPINLGSNTKGVSLYSKVAPGIMSFDVLPTVGVATGSTSPINKAAMDEYAFVVHKNSRNTTYEPADLMQYYISVASLFTFYAWAKRIYMYARDFSYTNSYLPAMQLQHMGVAIDSITNGSQLAAFRTYLNTFALNASRYRIPAKFNLLQTWYKLNQFVYLDCEDESKAQRYVFNVGFYQYEPYTDKRGGKLVYVPAPNVARPATSLEHITDIGERLLHKVELNEDIGTMMGDVEKAYGTENCFTIPLITEADMVAEAYYDHDLLFAIENARIGTLNSTTLDIKQENGLILYNPKVQVYLGWLNNPNRRFLINAHSALSPEQIAVTTSFMYPSDDQGTILSCGNAILTTAYVGSSEGLDQYHTITAEGMSATDVPSIEGYLKTCFDMSKFSHYPRYTYNKQYGSTAMEVNIMGWFEDIDQYTTIDAITLNNIHLGRNMADVGFGTQIYQR